jgi:glutathione S-transferase
MVAGSAMTELLGLPYSPWTEKARFALAARRIPHVFRRYEPLLGEPALRSKLRRLTGPVTVPVLTTDEGRILADSLEIARWADGRGEGPRLFPPEHEVAVLRFVALSERALASGRALSLQRLLADDEALLEMVPASIRRAAPALGTRAAALGIARTIRKYGADRDSREAHRRRLVAALDEIRAALAKAPTLNGSVHDGGSAPKPPVHDGGSAGSADSAGSAPKPPATLLGRFTFADIAMAQVLVSVEPPPSGLVLGRASRRAFVDPDLREPYADLCAWRDALYRAYRAS